MPIRIQKHFCVLMRYNAWCNQRIYSAVESLSDDIYRAEHKQFLGSIHGTLNHLLLTDRLWLDRMQRGLFATVPKLDDVVYQVFAELRAERNLLDDSLISFVNGLEEEAFNSFIQYRSSKGGTPKLTVLEILTSMNIHQNHHRGQVHHMLSVSGTVAPSLDFPTYIEELS